MRKIPIILLLLLSNCSPTIPIENVEYGYKNGGNKIIKNDHKDKDRIFLYDEFPLPQED